MHVKICIISLVHFGDYRSRYLHSFVLVEHDDKNASFCWGQLFYSLLIWTDFLQQIDFVVVNWPSSLSALINAYKTAVREIDIWVASLFNINLRNEIRKSQTLKTGRWVGFCVLYSFCNIRLLFLLDHFVNKCIYSNNISVLKTLVTIGIMFDTMYTRMSASSLLS